MTSDSNNLTVKQLISNIDVYYGHMSGHMSKLQTKLLSLNLEHYILEGNIVGQVNWKNTVWSEQSAEESSDSLALLPSSLLYFSSDRLTLSVFLILELTTRVKMYKLLAFAAVLAAGMYAITEIWGCWWFFVVDSHSLNQ